MPKSPRTRAEEREEVKLTLDLLEAFHVTGVSLATRTIYMGSESDTLEGETGTDAKMAERFIKNLHLLENFSSDRVTVIMNNLGGDCYHGFAIYDAITESSCQIEIVVRGYAMSMGSLILQAADIRSLGPKSTLMIHDGTMGVNDHVRTFLKWAEEAKRLNTLCEQIYIDRIREKQPKFSIARLKQMLDHDSCLSPEQAIALGLADKIR